MAGTRCWSSSNVRFVSDKDSRLRGALWIRRFVFTLRNDMAAVRNAISERWSNGQAEGQINLPLLSQGARPRSIGAPCMAAGRGGDWPDDGNQAADYHQLQPRPGHRRRTGHDGRRASRIVFRAVARTEQQPVSRAPGRDDASRMGAEGRDGDQPSAMRFVTIAGIELSRRIQKGQFNLTTLRHDALNAPVVRDAALAA